MPTVLITGANRGIGLELAYQYAAENWRVLALCRSPAKAEALRALGVGVVIHALDVTDLAAVTALAERLSDETIDVLIANAGILLLPGMSAAKIDAAAWQESFVVNAMAPLACAGAFVAHVARSRQRKMVAISSRAGSIGAVSTGGQYIYRSSKSALNMVWRTFACEHPEVIATLLSPGTVLTDMNPKGTIAAADSVAGLRRIIAGLTQKESGQFFRYDGESIPW